MAEEYAFDATELEKLAASELSQRGVRVVLNQTVNAIESDPDGGLRVLIKEGAGEQLRTRYIFNCSYSGMNRIHGEVAATNTRLKHEIAELALVTVPTVLQDFGITVMDGPFFSIMPFPSKNCHTLSHVRYTPHQQWFDSPDIDPYSRLDDYPKRLVSIG